MENLSEYFRIIRNVIKENRKKVKKVYYEAHHVVPKSFNKKSKLVLLTPEEHYKCHKILAIEFKNHSIYGKKMLWAFHRMTYSKNKKLTEEEYKEARNLLMVLWTRKQSEEHKNKRSIAMKGNSNNKNRVYKGMKSDMSNEGKQRLSQLRKINQKGKVGIHAKASKGIVVCEYEDGTIVEEGSSLQLSYKTNIPQPTISYRLIHSQGKMLKGYKIYYK
jgi:hypothetical protein